MIENCYDLKLWLNFYQNKVYYRQAYHENNMIFDDQPRFTQKIVDTQMTPVDTVRKENVWHPLKTMKFNPSFKPIIYVII